MKNKASLKRIKSAVRRGSIAAMQRNKERENTSQEATQGQLRVIFVRVKNNVPCQTVQF